MSVKTLAAIEEIKERLALYCRAMDRMDDELGLSLWTDDATVDYVDIFHGPPAEFIQHTHRLHASMLVTKHRLANHLIRIDGDRAVSEADGRITLVERDESGVFVRQSFGRYLDRWVRRGDRWLIHRRRYVRDFSLVSWPEVSKGSGQRSDQDASYELFPTSSFSSRASGRQIATTDGGETR